MIVAQHVKLVWAVPWNTTKNCLQCKKCYLQTHNKWTSHNLQWFDGWTPLAGNDLHEFKAAVVELNVGGIIILCVDLTGSQRTAVLRLLEGVNTYTSVLEFDNHSNTLQYNEQNRIPYICSSFSSWGWLHTPAENVKKHVLGSR